MNKGRGKNKTKRTTSIKNKRKDITTDFITKGI